MFKKEDAFILKPDGRRLGPYQSSFAGDTVIVNDQSADIDDGDQVSRFLPNGKEEIKHINSCNFYQQRIGPYGPHFQLKVKPVSSSESYVVKHQNITITGSNSNVQIGDHNRMEFNENIKNIINTLEESQGTKEQQDEAKSLLKKFLEHPLVNTIAGTALSALIK